MSLRGTAHCARPTDIVAANHLRSLLSRLTYASRARFCLRLRPFPAPGSRPGWPCTPRRAKSFQTYFLLLIAPVLVLSCSAHANHRLLLHASIQRPNRRPIVPAQHHARDLPFAHQLQSTAHNHRVLRTSLLHVTPGSRQLNSASPPCRQFHCTQLPLRVTLPLGTGSPAWTRPAGQLELSCASCMFQKPGIPPAKCPCPVVPTAIYLAVSSSPGLQY